MVSGLPLVSSRSKQMEEIKAIARHLRLLRNRIVVPKTISLYHLTSSIIIFKLYRPKEKEK